MKILFRSAVIATAASAILWFIASNTAMMVSTVGDFMSEFVVLEVPFTKKAYVVPNWMWRLYPTLVCSFSSVVAIGFWVVWGVKRAGARAPRGAG
jgi:hypothetical protein